MIPTATRPQRRGPLHHQRRRLLGHRRRLRPRPGHRRPLVPVHGGTPDRPQGHLGLPAQAAPGHRPPDQGGGRDGPLRRIPAVPGPVSHRRHLDHPHRAAARKPGLARAGLHPPGRVQLRAGRLPAAGPGPGRRAGAAPPLPGPAQPPAPAPLLAGLALAAGTGHRGDRPPGVRRAAGLHLQPQGRGTQGRPVGGGGGGDADPECNGTR